jgi:diguanylate cyclase (GGDEF)-like protein
LTIGKRAFVPLTRVVGAWQLRATVLLIDRASLESQSATIAILSILAIGAIFVVDLADGKEIWLHILYVFPIGVLALSCAGITPVVIGVLLSLVFLVITLLGYGLPTAAVTANMLIALAAYALVAGLTRLARTSAIAMEILATTDALTGLHNRRSFEKLAEQEIARTIRYGSTFSLALLDLNQFKLLNDSRGHGVGDEALRLLADVLRTNIRRVDFAARIGGDEFAIMMPGTDGTNCAALCEKLSSIIVDRMKEAGFALTASVGYVCSHDAPDLSLSVLMQKADEAMYAAKCCLRGKTQTTATPGGAGSIAAHGPLRSF